MIDYSALADEIQDRLAENKQLTSWDCRLVELAPIVELTARGKESLLDLHRRVTSGEYWVKCKCGGAYIPAGETGTRWQCGSITEVHYLSGSCFAGSF